MLALCCLRCLCLQGEYVAELGQDIEHWAWVSAFSPCVSRETSAHSTPHMGNQSFFPALSWSSSSQFLRVLDQPAFRAIQNGSVKALKETVMFRYWNEWKKTPLSCVMMRRTSWYLPCCFVSCIWLLGNCYHTVSKMLPFLDAFLPCLSLHKSLECGSRMSPWNIFVC